ncbi:MAG: hypothetical protein CSA45_01055 [Gammaproteobacteria bacterium]|nr:MAG: hypothetical protein CSA45_01055 [Gammaproteobacteria bacterium]
MLAKRLNCADVVITAGVPKSRQFDDIYFSPVDGAAESVYNFIDGNALATRFQQSSLNRFTIAETGFGTGLNFFLTLACWHKYAPDKACLHFISVEKYPLTTEQLRKIYADNPCYSEFFDAINQLLGQYPRLEAGCYHLDFGSVRLTLLFGDASEQFKRYDFTADAWFLDGFAPSKNPDMWSPDVFDIIAKRSRLGTTFATFTAASAIRKGLQATGFTVRKAKGFGSKRERLLGHIA